MKKLVTGLMLSIMFGAQAFGALTFTKDSVSVKASISANNTLYVKVCSAGIIRVVYVAGTTIPADTANYIVTKSFWPAVTWHTTETSSTYTVTTDSLQVNIDKTSGAVSFATAAGTPIVNETGTKSLTPVTISSVSAYTGNFGLNSTAGEGLYGFGQFQNGVVNQFGLTDSLAQHNQTDCSPFFMSTRGFGVLWINYSRGAAGSTSTSLNISCEWATNNAIDYYFIYGPEFDNIIAGYRTITGQARMWPKWAYGFWQCRNYYSTQSDLLQVVKTYRSKNYPIDNIVQDWNYYKQGYNGCQCFDKSRYPDPAGMIRTLHDSLNCHFTISVWPSFTSTSGNANYTFMNSRGYLLPVSDYLGQTYDAFNDSATFYYWKFINDSLVSKNIDGFWPDATEPESVGWPFCATAKGPGQEFANIFPLLHSKTLYDGFRKAFNGNKRVCNLTRSYYAGSQRLGAAYWTGDVGTDFGTFQKQIPAGLDFCMTGMPLFCTDVGGFTGNNTAEVEIRWFEWGAFNPVFRVHGTRNCNELWCWNDASGGNISPNPKSESILANYLNLRYRLFPYVYSLAGMVTQQNYTIMRALPFDFRNDPNVYNLSFQFMFGPAFLVCPVYTGSTTSISAYLPASTWYNFWTGDTLISPSGRNITARAPLDTMPLFVRAGSIVPMGPEVKYAGAAADPIELRVYTGASGSFTLYEDEKDNYNYENGAFASIPIVWNEATQMLSLGPTSGSFPGMLKGRTFKIVWVSHGHGAGEQVTADNAVDKIIGYDGGYKVSLNKTTGQIGVKAELPKMEMAGYALRQSKGMLMATLGGKQAWQVRLTMLSGREITGRTIKGGTDVVIAKGLSAGIYLVSLKYNGFAIANKTIIIP